MAVTLPPVLMVSRCVPVVLFGIAPVRKSIVPPTLRIATPCPDVALVQNIRPDWPVAPASWLISIPSTPEELTVSFELGEVVPIPTEPAEVMRRRSEPEVKNAAVAEELEALKMVLTGPLSIAPT